MELQPSLKSMDGKWVFGIYDRDRDTVLLVAIADFVVGSTSLWEYYPRIIKLGVDRPFEYVMKRLNELLKPQIDEFFSRLTKNVRVGFIPFTMYDQRWVAITNTDDPTKDICFYNVDANLLTCSTVRVLSPRFNDPIAKAFFILYEDKAFEAVRTIYEEFTGDKSVASDLVKQLKDTIYNVDGLASVYLVLMLSEDDPVEGVRKYGERVFSLLPPHDAVLIDVDILSFWLSAYDIFADKLEMLRSFLTWNGDAYMYFEEGHASIVVVYRYPYELEKKAYIYVRSGWLNEAKSMIRKWFRRFSREKFDAYIKTLERVTTYSIAVKNEKMITDIVGLLSKHDLRNEPVVHVEMDGANMLFMFGIKFPDILERSNVLVVKGDDIGFGPVSQLLSESDIDKFIAEHDLKKRKDIEAILDMIFTNEAILEKLPDHMAAKLTELYAEVKLS